MDRSTIRITNVYGTSWRISPGRTRGAAPTEDLNFGRLGRYYRTSADQLPAVLCRRRMERSRIRCQRWRAKAIENATMWLLTTASCQVVVALSLDVECSHREVIAFLEDCYYGELRFDGSSVEEAATDLARSHGVLAGEPQFAPECHQLVLSRRLRARDPKDVIQRLVYRVDLPYRPEYSTISYPAELNRRPNTTAALGPYVSVLCGQQDYVENAAFVSAVQVVASAVRLREIWTTAHHEQESFQNVGPVRGDTRSRRRALERLTDGLTRLELDLSGSVEVPADIGVVVPSLRVVAYHQEVYAATGLRERAATVSKMLQRLGAAARAELTSIESVERRADENRRQRWTVAIGFVSVVAIPLSLVLAFFGINASQVEPDRSMFHPAYAWVYTGVGMLAAIALLLALALYVHHVYQDRQGHDSPHEVPQLPAPRSAPAGDGGTRVGHLNET